MSCSRDAGACDPRRLAKTGFGTLWLVLYSIGGAKVVRFRGKSRRFLKELHLTHTSGVSCTIRVLE